jgi:hypothetical protein
MTRVSRTDPSAVVNGTYQTWWPAPADAIQVCSSSVPDSPRLIVPEAEVS